MWMFIYYLSKIILRILPLCFLTRGREGVLLTYVKSSFRNELHQGQCELYTTTNYIKKLSMTSIYFQIISQYYIFIGYIWKMSVADFNISTWILKRRFSQNTVIMNSYVCPRGYSNRKYLVYFDDVISFTSFLIY